MKTFLTTVTLALLMSACTSETSKGASSTVNDSGSHGTHGGGTGTGTSPGDTAGASGGSMMSLMHSNMEGMKAVPSARNPDNDYAALMKIHHMGAVEMAQLELARGTDPVLKQMAQKMITDQQQEIATLNKFVSGHNAKDGGDAFYKEAMAQMSNMKMNMDHSGSIDKQFVEMMIPHHEGAIDMSKAYLKSAPQEEQLKAMATAIISAQQKEIQQLKDWLTKNGGK